jgi:phosphoglycerate dehydrogenase-like enzyme
MSFLVPDRLLEAAPGIKWIQLFSAGADHMMNGAVGSSKVRITTTSGVHASSIAEFIAAFILMHAHRLHVTSRAQFRHQWLKAGDFMSTADSVRGRTLGIIGYGSIGRETARIAQSLGLDVLALKRHPGERTDTGWSPPGVGDPSGQIPRRIFGPEQLAELLPQCDFLAITLPLTAATHHFIGATELAALRPNRCIVHIGRGAVGEQAAVIEALKGKRSGGAGLDVFEREPLEADSPLWDFDEVIMTPHMAGPFRRYLDLTCELFAENLHRFASGQPLLNEVDRTLGY